jgi:ABC-type multidrug transport system ATPase subunit
MTALLGPSGSGKTTFLDVLACRKSVGETTGTMLFGGKAPTTQFIRRHTVGLYNCCVLLQRNYNSASSVLARSQYKLNPVDPIAVQVRNWFQRFAFTCNLHQYTAGYVEQFDTLISALTVREMLCYTAVGLYKLIALKAPGCNPRASCFARVTLGESEATAKNQAASTWNLSEGGGAWGLTLNPKP